MVPHKAGLSPKLDEALQLVSSAVSFSTLKLTSSSSCGCAKVFPAEIRQLKVFKFLAVRLRRLSAAEVVERERRNVLHGRGRSFREEKAEA